MALGLKFIYKHKSKIVVSLSEKNNHDKTMNMFELVR